MKTPMTNFPSPSIPAGGVSGLHGGRADQRRSPGRLLRRRLGPAGVADGRRSCAVLSGRCAGLHCGVQREARRAGPEPSTVRPEVGEVSGEVQPIS